MKTTFLYVLCDPVTGAVRYVGKANNPHTRLHRDHLGAARQGMRTHLYNWIRSLLLVSAVPKLEILFELPEEGWQSWEKYMIAGFKESGFDLVNQTPGGEGGPVWLGRKQTKEHIEKLRAARLGQKRTPEQCARVSAGKLGQKIGPQSLEHVAKRAAAVSAAKKGKPWTLRQRVAQAEARARKKESQD